MAIWKNGKYRSVLPVEATDHLPNNSLLSSEILDELTYGGLPIITSSPLLYPISSTLRMSNSNELAWNKLG